MKTFLLCLLTTLVALPKEVIFMRHANKDNNLPEGTQYVAANWKKPLTDDGKEDAKNIMKFLEKYNKKYGAAHEGEDEIILYSSPFRRAISTVACFAQAAKMKIRLDRSLGESSSWTSDKQGNYGVWDPNPADNPKEGKYNCPDNKCFMKEGDDPCKDTTTIEGTLGPHCDLPIRQVVEYCKLKTQGLNIIDPAWKQQDTQDENLSSQWFGQPPWKDSDTARADYVWNYIIKKATPKQRLIIVSHGKFMGKFFKKYVANSRKQQEVKWNTGTMNFLQMIPEVDPETQKPPYLRVVGERFSFASTNDLLWLPDPKDECKAKDTPFDYARDYWWNLLLPTPHTRYKPNVNKAKVTTKVTKIAREGEVVSGFVLEFEPRKACPGKKFSLEYMDCTNPNRISGTGNPICLLAGWYSLGGYKCVSKSRSLLFWNDDKRSAKSVQTLTGRPSTFNQGYGFFIKMKAKGLTDMEGGCEMEKEKLEKEAGGGGGVSKTSKFVAASNLPKSSNTASRLAFFFFGAFIFLGMYVVYSKSISKEKSYYSLLNTNGDGSEL